VSIYLVGDGDEDVVGHEVEGLDDARNMVRFVAIEEMARQIDEHRAESKLAGSVSWLTLLSPRERSS
jgi:hypothetical protein